MKNGCSDDSFLDFRAWLIAQGKETYLEALRDPDTLSQFNLGYSSEYTIPPFVTLRNSSTFPLGLIVTSQGAMSSNRFTTSYRGCPKRN